MCYSAMVIADYRNYLRFYGAGISLTEFVQMYVHRYSGEKIVVPKAVDDAFLESGEFPEVDKLIRDYRDLREADLQKEMFEQRTRLADAERSLLIKETKKALESRRVAGNKVEHCKRRLEDLNRTAPADSDRRMYPGQYLPVMVMENGKRVIRPMRYQCRPAGKPAFYDQKYPGTYNARRDNLEGFWKELFGVTHGIAVVNAFYENVATHKAEHRELAPGEKPSNIILEFNPTPTQDMLVACLWSHWQGADGEELTSFAFITDEPPEEVAAAGHDRCIIPIKLSNLDAWLQPQGHSLDDMYAILDDRERPYYEHRIAA
jgi:putative SOS response-associated peptidase YedK